MGLQVDIQKAETDFCEVITEKMYSSKLKEFPLLAHK